MMHSILAFSVCHHPNSTNWRTGINVHEYIETLLNACDGGTRDTAIILFLVFCKRWAIAALWVFLDYDFRRSIVLSPYCGAFRLLANGVAFKSFVGYCVRRQRIASSICEFKCKINGLRVLFAIHEWQQIANENMLAFQSERNWEEIILLQNHFISAPYSVLFDFDFLPAVRNMIDRVSIWVILVSWNIYLH